MGWNKSIVDLYEVVDGIKDSLLLNRERAHGFIC